MGWEWRSRAFFANITPSSACVETQQLCTLYRVEMAATFPAEVAACPLKPMGTMYALPCLSDAHVCPAAAALQAC